MPRYQKYTSNEKVDEWLQFLLDNGRKKGTVNNYRNNINRCFYYMELDGRSTRPEDITVDDVHYLWNRIPVKEAVRQQYLRSMAMYTLHYTGRDVVKQANILKNREVRERVFIEKSDFRKMWLIADPGQRMIMCLGAMLGLRREEISSVRDGDIVGNTLTVHGKGHGPDGLMIDIRIPGLVMAEIERYRMYKSQYERMDDYLVQFLDHGKRLKRMSKSRVGDSIHKLGLEAGVKATTHSLRRLYATMLFYDTKTDPQTVKTLMRHANMATTFKCYIEPSDNKARVAMDDLMSVMTSLIKPDDKDEKKDGNKG